MSPRNPKHGAGRLPTWEEMIHHARVDAPDNQVEIVSRDEVGSNSAGRARVLTVQQIYHTTTEDGKRLRVTRWLLATEEGSYAGGTIRSDWV